ncbi:MAG: hypothetical protein JW863_10995 [Chitinispirillaceae bacterium]|nr:hypothetical protein [Chitinispirillaceae bacterium]
MYLHHSFTRGTVLLLAASTVLAAGTLSSGYSRTRTRKENNRPSKSYHQHQRPQRVQPARRTARNKHYTYRHGRWFDLRPHARIAIGAPFGALVVSLPGIFRTAVFGGLTYYYCDGVFYHRHPHGYEIVRPPRVRYLPRHARRIVISGNAYFLHDDFYYRYQNGYFEVCEAPVVVADQRGENNTTTTIMIENSNGSRTPVELKPMGSNQWKGPNGEIYDGLPSDEQLQQAYGF